MSFFDDATIGVSDVIKNVAKGVVKGVGNFEAKLTNEYGAENDVVEDDVSKYIVGDNENQIGGDDADFTLKNEEFKVPSNKAAGFEDEINEKADEYAGRIDYAEKKNKIKSSVISLKVNPQLKDIMDLLEQGNEQTLKDFKEFLTTDAAKYLFDSRTINAMDECYYNHQDRYVNGRHVMYRTNKDDMNAVKDDVLNQLKNYRADIQSNGLEHVNTFSEIVNSLQGEVSDMKKRNIKTTNEYVVESLKGFPSQFDSDNTVDRGLTVDADLGMTVNTDNQAQAGLGE